LTTDHPLGFKSTHGFFFNPKLKYCDSCLINYTPLQIGNDVWIGQLAKLKPPGLVALVPDIQTFYRLIWINSQIQNLLIYCVYSSWE